MHLHKEIIIRAVLDGIINITTGEVITDPTRLNAMVDNNMTTVIISPIIDTKRDRVTIVEAITRENHHGMRIHTMIHTMTIVYRVT